LTNEKTCDCESKVETRQSYHLLLVWAIVTCIVVGINFLSQYVFPGEGPVLSRALVLNVAPDIVASTILMTALVLYDKITPGNTIECAGKEPLSASILLGSFVVALSIVMAAV
jgi:hypothetical protein